MNNEQVNLMEVGMRITNDLFHPIGPKSEVPLTRIVVELA